MDLNACMQLAVEHFKGKQIKSIALDYETSHLTEDRIHPLIVKSGTITIHFTDDTNIIMQAIEEHTGIGASAYSSGIKESRIQISFWGNKEFQNELSKIR